MPCNPQPLHSTTPKQVCRRGGAKGAVRVIVGGVQKDGGTTPRIAGLPSVTTLGLPLPTTSCICTENI